MVGGRTVTIAAATSVIIGGVLVWTHLTDTPAPASYGTAMAGGTPSTMRAALDQTIGRMRERVAADPGDGQAAVFLADALMRAARVQNDAALPLEAERVLKATLRHGREYGAYRMLAAVYLSQHRFADALDVATKAQAARPQDGWNYATAGDALLELGRYDEAFDMFEQAVGRRPDAGVYARVAYAKELQGDLGAALTIMKKAAEATAPQDVEAAAWVRTQLGLLHLQRGELDDARREFAHAEILFPGHPYPLTGQVRLSIERGDYRAALQGRTSNRCSRRDPPGDADRDRGFAHSLPCGRDRERTAGWNDRDV